MLYFIFLFFFQEIKPSSTHLDFEGYEFEYKLDGEDAREEHVQVVQYALVQLGLVGILDEGRRGLHVNESFEL